MHAHQLHVITARVNPLQWKVPEEIYKDFETHMLSSGVHLTTVECAHGDRDFFHDRNSNINHIGVRAKTMMWTKENLLNIGIRSVLQKFPDAKYFAWIDADVFFQQPDWAVTTLHALQTSPVIQNWTSCIDLGPKGEIMQLHTSFCYQYFNGFNVKPGTKWAWSGIGGPRFPHPGYSWAATREALESTGGLLEMGALGSGDAHMALGYVGMASGTYSGLVHENYKRQVLQWEQLALNGVVNRNLGVCPCTLTHRYHGKKANRAYNDRWKILEKHNYDPVVDSYKNLDGVCELTGNKPDLTRDMMHYFGNRLEDANTM